MFLSYLTPHYPLFASGRLRAQTPSGGSGPLRRACAPFAAKAAQGCRRQTPAAARGYALSGRSGLRPSLVRGDTPRNAPSKTIAHPPYAVIPAVRLIQGGGSQPTASPKPEWHQG